jgi:DedD protein
MTNRTNRANRVRDLEQLQEQDAEERQRKRGTLAMAALAILMLAFAIGMVVGKAFEPASPARDPLDQLDRVAEASRAPDDPQPSAAKVRAKVPDQPAVEAADLSFERRLTGEEERPEVLAAIEAAEREEAQLAIHTAAPLTAAAPESEALALENDIPGDLPDAPTVVPANMAAGLANQKLERAKQHDPLIASALPRRISARAARGNEGEYTLQVISYDSHATAEAFANALRARGHEAFVTVGEVEGRGRYYRVRVGPFGTREAAEEYRRAFEERERMNTIVIKRSSGDGERE